MNARIRKTRGFTLVEILIVVIILGILAAIVIPQFTNASQDARKNSLTSQLQTMRSQVELYKLQHLDENPPGLDTAGSIDGAVAGAEYHVKPDADHTINVNGKFGPYLQPQPLNPLSEHPPTDSRDVFVVLAFSFWFLLIAVGEWTLEKDLFAHDTQLCSVLKQLRGR